MPDKDPIDQVEEIINDSDEGVGELIEGTESYDEDDPEMEDEPDDGDPEELNFEPDSFQGDEDDES